MKNSTYPSFYRQPPHPHPPLYGLPPPPPPFLHENFDPPFHDFSKIPTPPINKKGVHTMLYPCDSRRLRSVSISLFCRAMFFQ